MNETKRSPISTSYDVIVHSGGLEGTFLRVVRTNDARTTSISSLSAERSTTFIRFCGPTRPVNVCDMRAAAHSSTNVLHRHHGLNLVVQTFELLHDKIVVILEHEHLLMYCLLVHNTCLLETSHVVPQIGRRSDLIDRVLTEPSARSQNQIIPETTSNSRTGDDARSRSVA